MSDFVDDLAKRIAVILVAFVRNFNKYRQTAEQVSQGVDKAVTVLDVTAKMANVTAVVVDVAIKAIGITSSGITGSKVISDFLECLKKPSLKNMACFLLSFCGASGIMGGTVSGFLNMANSHIYSAFGVACTALRTWSDKVHPLFGCGPK